MEHRWFLGLVLLFMETLAVEAPALAEFRNEGGAPKNVVLVILDGVRWQEFFFGVDPSLSKNDSGDVFPNIWKDLIHEGITLGDHKKSGEMTVSNPALISLPAYQSIMAGQTQGCWTNSCGRIGVETLQERLVRELKTNKRRIATIASWEKIPNAVEHVAGTTFVNAAFQPLDDGEFDPEFDAINEAQKKDPPPWGGARFDRYTFAHALHYLKKHEPRFLFISLNDSDEWGHRSDYPRYLATLRQYDAWIKELVDTLKSMGEHGSNTTLLVTTDHGRGDDKAWANHGAFWPSSKYVWLYGRSPHTAGGRAWSGIARSHLDIRPTIEAASGIAPISCKQCGHPLSELFR